MNIHFIAIGGSAMHNLAIALSKKGYKITGSDDAIFEPSKSRLEKNGLLPSKLGWFPDKITKKLDAVILGMHAKPNNSELIKARELQLKIYSYPEFLFEQSKNKTRVVIGGSHGKTTITAMILHVLNYFEKPVDFMVGAQLDGFDTMVHLTKDNEFIILEGDEYLSSAIDLRPKFHLYKPNIALLSGIAWDHINVFPTFFNYLNQFSIFINSISKGGILVFNEEDNELLKLVNETENEIKKYPYHTPKYKVINDTTFLETNLGELPLEIFGKHNLQNLAGAKWICQHIGIQEDDFYEAIASFKGASKRLEKIGKNKDSIIYKDFAHSPSKVKATVEAVKDQYENKKIVACLELHTYSSLNQGFLKEYKNALVNADEAVVYYSPNALKIKELPAISKEDIKNAFQLKDLTIYDNPADFKTYIFNLKLNNSVLLLMSSGNYGGLDFNELSQLL
ncbi:MAG: UDP-N-acetylmuramate--L-alanine ligase [Lutibacter sp.]